MTGATTAIILYNFNGARELRASLDAILGQTRPADQILVIDDGSIDDSPAIIDAAVGRDPRVSVVRNDRNLGLPASRARALAMVVTDYLVWTTVHDRLLPTLLEGKPHEWAKEFDPKRVTLHPRELGTLAKENLDVALQFGDYLTPGQVGDVASIPNGEGRVIRRGAHKIAVYKDDAGRLHERSAACTHVKCIVDWNTAEKSWDCPCHGSRFDPFGKVLNGPAIDDLHPAP